MNCIMGMRILIRKMDDRILDFVHDKANCKFLNFVMPKITTLGDCGIIWIITAFILIGHPKYTVNGYLILVAQICGAIVGNVFLKHVFARPRPCWANTDISLLIKLPKDYSFPSGHTLSSVTATIILIHTNAILGISAIMVCLAIIFSRMYLYVHYPSDILGGVALGIIISLILIKVV